MLNESFVNKELTSNSSTVFPAPETIVHCEVLGVQISCQQYNFSALTTHRHSIFDAKGAFQLSRTEPERQGLDAHNTTMDHLSQRNDSEIETQTIAAGSTMTVPARPSNNLEGCTAEWQPNQRLRVAGGAVPVYHQQQNVLPAQLFHKTQPTALDLIADEMTKLDVAMRHNFLAAVQQNPDFSQLFINGSTITQTPSMRETLSQIATKVKNQPAEEEQQGGELNPASSASPPAVTISLVPEFEEYSCDAGTNMRAVVSVKAKTDVTKQTNVALSCILDKSTSMTGPRLQLMQQTSHFLIDQLCDKDYLGFVTYSGTVSEDLPLVRMTTVAKQFAHRVIDAIKVSFGTALYAGLEKGIQQLQGVTDNRLVKCGFLCTDGEANIGFADLDTILPALKETPGQQDVQLHTFGFGHRHSVSLLQALSDAQDGTYYYVARADDIPKAYGDALGGLLATAAKDIKVTITPEPASVIKTIKAANPICYQDGSRFVRFADIYAEERREIFVSAQLPVAEAGSRTTIVTATLEYLDPADGTRKTTTETLSVPRAENLEHTDEAGDILVTETLARFETAEALEQATKYSTLGNHHDAFMTIRSHITQMHTTGLAGRSSTIDMFMKQSTVAAQTLHDEGNLAARTTILHAAGATLRSQRARNASITERLPSNDAYATRTQVLTSRNAYHSVVLSRTEMEDEDN